MANPYQLLHCIYSLYAGQEVPKPVIRTNYYTAPTIYIPLKDRTEPLSIRVGHKSV